MNNYIAFLIGMITGFFIDLAIYSYLQSKIQKENEYLKSIIKRFKKEDN